MEAVTFKALTLNVLCLVEPFFIGNVHNNGACLSVYKQT